MTYRWKTIRGLAVSCSLLLLACDTDPGDVGESAGGTSTQGQPTTSDTTSASGSGPVGTSGTSGTTADPSMSGTTDAPGTQGTATTTEATDTTTTDPGTSEGSTGSETDASTSTGGSGTGGTQVDDCSECEDGDVCVRYVALTSESFCFPMPAECESGIDCGCGASFCNELYDTCIEPAEDDTLHCECSICA